jgi:hypothetical protein
MTANGVAQRQRRDCETPLHYRATCGNAPARERRSRCPLEPVLGGRFMQGCER